MRSVTCPHCKRVTDEASEGWDKARSTGACPHCGEMLDAAVEGEAVAAATSPALQSRVRWRRLIALVLGSLSIVVFFTGLLFNATVRWPVAVFGVAALLFAAFYRPADEARHAVKKETDLERLRDH